MATCDYCRAAATAQIPATPGRVCQAHAQEFWTDLLRYNRDKSRAHEHIETPSVRRVDDLTWAKLRDIAAAPPLKGGDVSMRRAS